MSNENADLIGRAYEAYANGDLAAMLEFVDPDLEWTYLDPTLEHPSTGARERPANRTASSAEAAEGTAELVERLSGTHAYAPSRDLVGRRTDTTEEAPLLRSGARRPIAWQANAVDTHDVMRPFG